MNTMLTRRHIFDILRQKSGESRNVQSEHLLNFLIQYFGIEENTDAQTRLKKDISRFCSKLYEKFDNCARIVDRFLYKNDSWLKETFVFNLPEPIALSSGKAEKVHPPTGTHNENVGRPRLSFSEIGDRAKRKRVAHLTETYEAKELTFAAKKGLKEEGQQSASKLLSEAVFTTPTRADKIRTSWLKSNQHQNVMPFSEDEAVSLIVEAKLSKHQYLLIRREAKIRNCDIYPNYNKVLEAKKRCYPSHEAFIVTETMAEIRLQALLDHTSTRLHELQTPVLLTLDDDQLKNLILLVKWGYDGSTGHSQYKQRFEEAGLGDGDLFLTSLVPLQLYCEQPNKEKNIVWQNPRPASTRYCRPIRFQFQKESSELSLEEKNHIESQIAQLTPTFCKLQERNVLIRHICIMSMINGKVCNAITDTSSSQVCYVCHAKPVEMNNIDKVLQKEVNEVSFQFGLSTLHAWIRCFECLLHVSYRLDFKKWQVRGENKPIFELRKKKIQEEFKSKMGLLVDYPRSGGSGTSNDGNTARRFFKDTARSSAITGVNEEVIKRFSVVLSTLSCGYEVNCEAYHEFAVQTARLFVATYPWYYMPASVHKILLHGSAIIRSALLPIGQLSEEAQESRNKDLKNFREYHTRKSSRVSANVDLINRLLISSDPIISAFRHLPKRKLSTLPVEVIGLLKEPAIKSNQLSGSVPMMESTSGDSESDMGDETDTESE